MISKNSERPFLIYANAFLSNDSLKELQKTVDNIRELFPQKMPNTLWCIFLTAIKLMSNYKPPSEDGRNFLKKLSYHTKSDVSSWIVYETNYYHSYSCDCTKQDSCRSGRYRQHIHQYFASFGHKKIQCYQCDQIAIHLFLKKLIKGEILDFEKATDDTPYKINYVANTLSTINDFKDIFLSNIKFVNIHNIESQKEMINDNVLDKKTTRGWENIISLQDMTLGLIADDIIDFVNFSDYRLLKRCDFCNQFYIAKKVNPKQRYCPECSKKNKWTKEERAAYQKNYNKEQKKRKEKEKKRRLEHEISNLIAQGIRPKEAKELAALKIKDK